jgi:cytochrome c oxidase subunit 2
MTPHTPSPADYPLLFWPFSASHSGTHVDWLILAFTAVTLLLTVPIFIGITYFALIYRANRQVDRSHTSNRNVKIELSWMLIPFALTLCFFAWGAGIFDSETHPPANALEIQAIGRQWMWKFEHPGGQAEINDLHVPSGQPVLINMISQDVIHSLYLPAFRVQMETLPGRYTQLWFNADRNGTYRLYCSEYCGTDHSIMDGNITVMPPADYAKWLNQAGSSQSLAAVGKRLFTSYGCSGCHGAASTVRAPSLVGLFGSPVPLASGGTLIADDSYIRDKILNPDNNLVAGYKQVMPSFNNLIPEDDLIQLIAYIKSDQQTAAQEVSP